MLLVGTVAAFKFYFFMDTWFYHQWTLPNFSMMRHLFCPADTADTKCNVPIGGGKFYSSETAWCMSNHNNATDCHVRMLLHI